MKNLDKCRIVSTPSDSEALSEDDNMEDINRPKAWNKQKQSDEEWLQGLSGLIIGGENADSAAEVSKKDESSDGAGHYKVEWFILS